MENKMLTLADNLKSLRDEKKQLEDKLKNINSQIDETDYRLAIAMAESETQNFTHSGTMFCLTTKMRVSPIIEQKSYLFEELKNKGYGDLVYETVNSNSLSAFVKEQMAENNDTLPNWLIGLVRVFEKTTVTVRKTSK